MYRQGNTILRQITKCIRRKLWLPFEGNKPKQLAINFSKDDHTSTKLRLIPFCIRGLKRILTKMIPRWRCIPTQRHLGYYFPDVHSETCSAWVSALVIDRGQTTDALHKFSSPHFICYFCQLFISMSFEVIFYQSR